MDIASVRILRMSFATGLCMFVSQVFNWPLSFIAPVFTMFILALPLPAMSFSGGIKFVISLVFAVMAGLVFLPFIVHYRTVGLLLVSLALFWSFYSTAKGGSPIVGAFITISIALVTAVGSVSIDAIFSLISGLTVGALVGVAFVWVGHAMMPDSKALVVGGGPPPKPPAAPKPDLEVARKSAYRSLIIVMPVLIWFLLSSTSASNLAVMIKVASMGQQVSLDHTREAAKSLLLSTVIGGTGAIIIWQVLSFWPSLPIYCLLIVLGGLVMGHYIFEGPALHRHAGTWSYGYLTMIIVIAPAVLDGQAGSSADAAFWSRLLMFLGASLYGVVAVYVFDLFWAPKRQKAVTPTA